MFPCPNCRRPLVAHRGPNGMFWSCSTCDGRIATVDSLRKSADHEAVNALWRAMQRPLEASQRVCPSCDRVMSIAIVETDAWKVPVDACATCQWVWFDRGEIERLGKRSSRPTPTLAPRSREAVARAEVAGQAADAEAQPTGDVETWQAVLATLGFPIVLDPNAASARPWIVLGFIASALIVGAAALTMAPELVTTLGFPNGDSFVAWCGSFVASAWVPTSWRSLVAVLFFLAVFGGEVELALGRVRFVVFALLALAAGHAGFLLGSPPPGIVHVGAGAVVSACVAFFALLFPRARVHVFVAGPLWSFARFLSLPVWLWLALWIAWLLVQAFGPTTRADATTSLAGGLLGIGVGAVARWIGKPRGAAPKLRIGPR